MQKPLENNQEVKIHQAYYGEVSRSHGCIVSSINDEHLNSFLTGFSDKPYPIPVGITLDTYYSATVFTRYFIVTKTIPDHTASRPGMVFTHALIINLTDAERIADLGKIFACFIDDIPEQKGGLLPIFYKGSFENQTPSTIIYPAYLQQSVGFLIQGLKVAFFGNLDNFLDTVTIIWDGLPAQLRKYLTFSIGFSLEDINNKKEPLLYFQKQLASRIGYAGNIDDDNNQQVEINNSVEKLILGHQQANGFNEFLNLLNFQLHDFNQLSIAEKAYQLYQRINDLQADDLRQLIRLLAVLSPSATDGIAFKNTVISKVGEFIDGGQDYKVKALRNITLSGFQSAENELSDKIVHFIINQFTNKLRFDTTVVNDMITAITNEPTSNWWYKAVNDGLLKALQLSNALNNTWVLLKYAGTNLGNLFPLIKSDQKQEDALIQHFPTSLSTDNAINLKTFFKIRDWNRLYAYTSLAHLEPIVAFKEQLTVEHKLNLANSQGVQLIAKRISDEKLLDFNLTNKDDKALALLISRIVKNNSLLEKLDVNNAQWLVIWDLFLKKGNTFEIGIINIRAKADQLYQRVIKKQAIPEQIISMYSQSIYADLSSYEDRKEFWSSVPPSYKDGFLQATATGYAKHITDNSSSSVELLEPELVKVMTSDQFVSGYLSKYRGNLEAAIAYYETFTSLKDSFLSDYINYFPASVSDFTSARLGHMVLNRQYKQTASSIFNKAKNNRSFRIALNKCKPLLSLGIFDKVLYGGLFGETLNEETAYDALFELVKQLYKTGPEEEKIWERAGGDDSKLVNQNSREENWRRALHLVRHGGGGKHLSVKSLLKEMQKDFSGNLILKELQQYFKYS